jgi:hypothetical protein
MSSIEGGNSRKGLGGGEGSSSSIEAGIMAEKLMLAEIQRATEQE